MDEIATNSIVRRSGADVLAHLVDLLERAGYAEFCSSFQPTVPLMHAWENRRNCTSESLQPLLDLFLLGRTVVPERLSHEEIDLAHGLSDLGLVKFDAQGGVQVNGLSLFLVSGLWLFYETPSSRMSLYYGDDSFALMNRLRPRRERRTLDLCSGPGIQALHCASRGAVVTAVDINPIASSLCRINAVMNKLSIEVASGSLYKPIAGRRFEHIIANPPLLPLPAELGYLLVGHGGPDGLGITREILRGLPEALEPTGICQMIGTALSDGLVPLFLDEFKTWANKSGMQLIVTVTSHSPAIVGNPFFDILACSVQAASGEQRSDVVSAIHNDYLKQGATGICTYFLQASFGKPGMVVNDLSLDDDRLNWYC